MNSCMQSTGFSCIHNLATFRCCTSLPPRAHAEGHADACRGVGGLPRSLSSRARYDDQPDATQHARLELDDRRQWAAVQAAQPLQPAQRRKRRHATRNYRLRPAVLVVLTRWVAAGCSICLIALHVTCPGCCPQGAQLVARPVTTTLSTPTARACVRCLAHRHQARHHSALSRQGKTLWVPTCCAQTSKPARGEQTVRPTVASCVARNQHRRSHRAAVQRGLGQMETAS